MRSLLLAAFLALVLVAAGCGSGGEAKKAVRTVAEGLAEQDGEKACGSLTNSAGLVVARLKSPPVRCPQVVESLPAGAFADCDDLEVKQAKVQGRQARVEVERPDGGGVVFVTNVLGTEWKLRTLPCGPTT